ncbi:MAG: hypothetical protein K940chlam7_00978 [Chlamydiae bacterium]|nr:hypothetical protein [Chlamydiota bacterium]
MTNPAARKVLYFDFDETLAAVQLTPYSPLPTSQSAEPDVSVSGPGVVNRAVLERTVSGSERGAEKVSAFALPEFRAIFQRISAINHRAQEKAVYVRVLTNASYTQDAVLPILKSWYGDGFQLDGFENRFRLGVEDIRERPKPKFLSMLMDFKRTYRDQGVTEDNVYLIDDAEENCRGAEIAGFKAIRMETNPRTRVPGASYTAAKPEIFGRLNGILDEVEAALDAS